ncbi:hypothetical protein RHGRI_012879 [Rhododendron griersonianum]|uniref:Chlorophyll a-b binding protein, chloroplastic n=1 Tax=Rhododendron griersonianum TaxID=479676 RepID=A0AAV6K3Q6_9ERIC|nr:hypothetical protein RHGRI_012879 [Rhododendron griersonianum]
MQNPYASGGLNLVNLALRIPHPIGWDMFFRTLLSDLEICDLKELWLSDDTDQSSCFGYRGIPRKASGKLATCLASKTRLNATKKGGRSSVCEPLPPDRPLWFPGTSPPEWLDGRHHIEAIPSKNRSLERKRENRETSQTTICIDLPSRRLWLRPTWFRYACILVWHRSDPDSLKWFAQAELMHSRWAMLAVAGILFPEWLEIWGRIENYSWFDAGAIEYFADPITLFVVQMILMGWVEGRRWADMLNPGCVDMEFDLPHKTKPKPDVGYPGGLWFDPLMWGRGSPQPVMVLRTKEIKNGRLAMLAFVGFCFQAVYTGQGPLENLATHIADPGHCNIFSAFTSQCVVN